MCQAFATTMPRCTPCDRGGLANDGAGSLPRRHGPRYRLCRTGERCAWRSIHLSGAISTGGTNPTAFTLPAAFAPATDVYVPVDLCSTTKGRLVISAAAAR